MDKKTVEELIKSNKFKNLHTFGISIEKVLSELKKSSGYKKAALTLGTFGLTASILIACGNDISNGYVDVEPRVNTGESDGNLDQENHFKEVKTSHCRNSKKTNRRN